MEKKNKLLFASLAILVTACVALVFLMRKGASPEIDPALFKIENIGKVDRVLLESANGKTELNFEDGRWRVNRNFDADKQMIKVLFATLDQVVPKREVSKSRRDSVISDLSKAGITVSLYEGEEIRKKFVAVGNRQKTETYFQLASDQIYTMNIPGYRVYVGGIFEADQGMWRDKLIFNLNWRNFKELNTRFPQQPKEDFHVSFKGKYFGVDGINALDTTKLNDYLDAVSLLQTDEYLSQQKMTVYDSLLKTAPAFTIEVKDIADRIFALDVFTPEKNSATVVGRTKNGEVVTFTRNAIAPVAKNRSYFVSDNLK